MATVNMDNIVKGCVSLQGFMIHPDVKVNHASFPIKQGELVMLDAGIAKPITADADVAKQIGVALQPSAVSSNLDNSSAPAEKTIQVAYGVIASFKTVAADVYTDGVPVYYSTDAQTVTSTIGALTQLIGVVRLPPAVASITGATGVMVPILVYSHALVEFSN